PSAHHRPGTLLIIVPDWYSQIVPKRVKNVEALGLRYVFQIDSSERRLQPPDCILYFFRNFCSQANRIGVHASQILEQKALPFHHRQTRLGSDVAKPQDSSTVSDYGYAVRLVSIIVHLLRIMVNFSAGICDARCIPYRKVVVGVNGNLRADLNFPVIVRMIFHGESGRRISTLQQFDVLSHRKPSTLEDSRSPMK